MLRFRSEVPLDVSGQIEKFSADGPEDVLVHVRIGRMPLPQARRGSDYLLDYAGTGEFRFAAAVMGGKPSSIVTVYDRAFRNVTVWLNLADYGPNVLQMSKVLQHFPMRELMIRHDTMILHASRVMLGGRAVLFSAPSGTGKTTQANLWKSVLGAEIVSNDRTVIRKTRDGILTSGYAVDGGAPVCDPRPVPPCALVILRQGPENHAERLPVSAAFCDLIGQTALDLWNPEEIAKAEMLWLDILSECPAWRLTCRPDEEAVNCLYEALRRENCFGEDS